MGKGLPRSMKSGPPLRQEIMKVTFAVRDLAIEIDGATGVGWGTAVIGGLPEGNLLFLGAAAYMQVTGPTSGSLVDTWAGDFGVGTTPASDGTISAGDIDIIGSTAFAAATAEASPRTRGISVNADAGEVHDNTDGSLEVNLNVLVDDADISADDLAFLANGEVELAFIMLMDD